jgi:hypothetical protein
MLMFYFMKKKFISYIYLYTMYITGIPIQE